MKEKTYLINEYADWNFVMENLPNYHQRDDVLYNDIVCRYVNGEEISESDMELMKNHFNSVEEAEKWLDKDIKRLFLETVSAMLDGNQIISIKIMHRKAK